MRGACAVFCMVVNKMRKMLARCVLIVVDAISHCRMIGRLWGLLGQLRRSIMDGEEEMGSNESNNARRDDATVLI